MATTRGPQALVEWLEKHERDGSWLATKIGAHQTSVSRWVRGESPPKTAMAVKIRDLTGIPIEAWLPGEPVDAAPPSVPPPRHNAA